MAINDPGINEYMVNDGPINSIVFNVVGFDANTIGGLDLGIGFEIGMDLTETLSPVGLFFWNNETHRQYEEIIAADLETSFDSIRDNGDNNKHLERELRVITGVQVNHICIMGDIL